MVLLLILVRPVVDTLYFLKDVSIFLSPLIWIAALTPVLVFLSLTLGKKQSIKTGFSYIDLMMVIWVGVVLINTLQLYFEMDVLTASDIFLRSTMPYIIYFYSRYFIRSMRNLYFLVITALFAALIPAGIFILDLLIVPFGTQLTSGSIIGYHRLYADICHYSISSISAFIMCVFLFLGPASSKSGQLISGKTFTFIVLFIFVVLLQIAHATTFIIFLILFLLFIYLNKDINFLRVSFVAVTLGSLLFMIFSNEIQSVAKPMIDREIGILKGERDIELLGHGRIGRIIDYQEVWSQQPAYAKIFGMSFSYVSDKEDWFGGSIHNEYLRSLYTGGVIGFLAFILLLLIALWKSRKFPASERYLFYGLTLATIFYSFTMLPMLYYNLLYLFMPAMAYLAHTSNLSKHEIRQIL